MAFPLEPPPLSGGERAVSCGEAAAVAAISANLVRAGASFVGIAFAVLAARPFRGASGKASGGQWSRRLSFQAAPPPQPCPPVRSAGEHPHLPRPYSPDCDTEISADGSIMGTEPK